MKRTIEKIVTFAIQIADPDQIILFGSIAHGTNNVHSDVDILIVADDVSQKKMIVERLEQFAMEMALQADVLVYSKVELELATKQPNSFLAGIRQSGKILYQKGGK